MKRIITLTLVLLLAVGSLAGCQKQAAPAKTNKLSIVTTIFPEYDWVREILGDKAEDAEITMLLDNGVDLHSYQPTAEDILKISTCDLFVYVGGESDGWVKDVLAQATNKDMVVINLLETLGDRAKAEEVVEGMETDHDHSHGHSKEVSTFEDNEVQDRSLSDWAGEWQSAYPLALDGALDKAFEAKAESGEMTADEYKEYYQRGYKTDYNHITIDGDTITFTDNKGNTAKSDYRYVGYVIQDWSSGTRAALYRFEAADKKSGTPAYIEFNDHMIEPAQAAHFHIRMSKESFDAISDLETSWPTFFPADLSAEQVCEELIGHNHSDEDEEHAHEEHEHEEELDEHVWLSLKNASLLCDAIADALIRIDGENANVYENNVRKYKERLNALDNAYSVEVSGGSVKTLLFGDRFPFRYLVDDYGLSYHAAFVGCSAETEASFETVSFLAKKVDELKLPCVLTIEGAQHKIAETIVQNTRDKNQKVLTMDSMQATTSKDVKSGTTYLSVMENNLSVLKEALD